MPTHELEFSTFTQGHYVDLMPYQYGREACEPGHAFGPARRSHFLFHYIISGRGLLMTTDEKGIKTDYRLSGGEGFLIFPGQVNTYVADLDDPWEYISTTPGSTSGSSSTASACATTWRTPGSRPPPPSTARSQASCVPTWSRRCAI